MLIVTENAVMVIRDLTAQQGALQNGGLRIVGDPSAGSLTIEVVEQPAQGDQVVDNSGARLFLDSEAVQLLMDKALDAAVDDEGNVQFEFADRPQ
jgi:iron-sulfur cluster assembly protein